MKRTLLSLAIAGLLLPASGHAAEADLLKRIDQMSPSSNSSRRS